MPSVERKQYIITVAYQVFPAGIAHLSLYTSVRMGLLCMLMHVFPLINFICKRTTRVSSPTLPNVFLRYFKNEHAPIRPSVFFITSGSHTVDANVTAEYGGCGCIWLYYTARAEKPKPQSTTLRCEDATEGSIGSPEGASDTLGGRQCQQTSLYCSIKMWNTQWAGEGVSTSSLRCLWPQTPSVP